MTQLSITEYTQKSFVVRGVTPDDTRDNKDELKKLGGKFNPKLRSIDGDKYDPGWIFPVKSKGKVQTFIDKINDEDHQDQDDTEEDDDSKDSDKDDAEDQDDSEDQDDEKDSDYKDSEEDSDDYKDSVENSENDSVYEKPIFFPKINSRRRKRSYSMTNGGLYPIYPTHVNSSNGNNYIEYNWIDNGPSKRHKSSHHNDETMKLYKNSLFWWYYSCVLTFSTAFFIFYLFSTGTLLVSPYFRDFFWIRELGVTSLFRLPGLDTNNGENFSGDFGCNISRVFDVAA